MRHRHELILKKKTPFGSHPTARKLRFNAPSPIQCDPARPGASRYESEAEGWDEGEAEGEAEAEAPADHEAEGEGEGG